MDKERESGVDIDIGNRCSRRAYELSKETFANRSGKPGAPCMSVDGLFSNMLDFNGTKIGISSDGIGTKIELAERCGIYDTLGYDLLAMVADDLAAGGFVPTNISNIIDVDFLEYDIIDSLMSGLKKACDECGVAISGGEIAELGGRISGYGSRMHFNWCSTAIGILHDALAAPLDGSSISEGDAVITLKSRGFRSNGFSLVRRTMESCLGEEWHLQPYNGTTYGNALLTPSLVYSPLITELMNRRIVPSSVVHVTGGGVADNFARVLKKKRYGAVLNSLFDPHDIMVNMCDLAGIDMRFAYRYWNMGNGMLLTVPETLLDAALDCASFMGYDACRAGIIDRSGSITIPAADAVYDVEE
ncbi:MAG: AIR synthase-related protein [Spirochaetota bacterium]